MAEAMPIARTLEGEALDADALSEALVGSRAKLTGYSVPQETEVRGIMSEACRLNFEWSDAAPSSAPASAFYKRICFNELESARKKLASAPHKLVRDVNSYAVEAAWLKSRAAKLAHTRAGIRVPRAYRVEAQPAAEPIESRFSLLVEDFHPDDGWYQSGFYNLDEARSSLSAFARLHAFYWSGSKALDGEARAELENAVWPSGAYWQPCMQTEDQFTQLASHWEGHVERFGMRGAPELDGVDVDTLGERLQAVARAAGDEAHPFGAADPAVGTAARPLRTLTHGDPKAGNLFLNRNDASLVGLIDFQWMGFGLAATEVSHHFIAAFSLECLDREEELLDHYYGELIARLVEYGAASDVEAASALYPRAKLQRGFDVGVLDLARCVFGYQWSRAGANPESLARNANTLGRNTYNKSLPHALRLVAKCDALLRTTRFE